MPTPDLTRRDFIKLLGVSPLCFTRLPKLSLGKQSYSPHQQIAATPNFIIVLFDTLSARNLSLYGYPRQTTPNLERLAQRATVYHRHYAPANFTSPGTASLLTGVYPWRHKAIHMHSKMAPEYVSKNLFALPEAYATFAYTHNPLAYILLHQEQKLIDVLSDIEELCLYSDSAADRWFNRDYSAAYEAELLLYRNGHYPSGSLFFSIFDRIRRSIQQGRMDDQYLAAYPRGVPNYFDEDPPSFIFFNVEQAVDWIIEQASSQAQPFLGYVHLLPPHGPHTTTRQFIDIFDDDYKPPTKPTHPLAQGLPQDTLNLLRRYYDEAIAYVDSEFERLFTTLEQSGVLKNTWLIFTSDHGELFERGTYSHMTPLLYEPLLHIPMVIWQPDQTTRRDIHTLTSNIDLLPTLFRAAQAPAPEWSDGKILPSVTTPGLSSQPTGVHRDLFALEAGGSSRRGPLREATVAFYREQHKLIYYTGYEDFETQYELYDVVNDPEELNNLYSTNNPIAREMKDELDDQLVKAEQESRE